jgi:N-methylhydantoinase B
MPPIEAPRISAAAWNAVRGAEVELRHTAPSTNVGDERHFAVAIADAEGRILSISRPSMIGALALSVRDVIGVGGPIPVGAVALTNDPRCGALHIHDFTVVAPIGGQRLAGYAAALFHTADFGGDAIGGYNPCAAEIWAEGAVIPPIVVAEPEAESLITLLASNTRLPDLFTGDLTAAMRAVSRVAEAALPMMPALAGVIGNTRSRVSEMLQGAGVGRWNHSATLGHCCTASESEIRAALELVDGRALLDFGGSSAAVDGFVNSSLASTVFAATLPFVDALQPADVNHGVIECVTVRASSGTIVAAPPTAATAWGPYATAEAVAELVSGLMARAGLTPRPTEHWTRPPPRRFHIQACDGPECTYRNRATHGAAEPRQLPRY